MMSKSTGTMTERERVETVLRHEKPDRVPIWPFGMPGFSMVYAGGSIADFFNKPEFSYEAQRKTCQDFGWVFSPMMTNPYSTVVEFGGEIKLPDGEYAQGITAARVPVETVNDAWKLKRPNVKRADYLSRSMEFYKIVSRESLYNEPVNMAISLGGPFSNAAKLPGEEKFCKWLLKEPKAAHRLLRLTTDYLLDVAQLWKDIFEIERVILTLAEPTSANQVISPAFFEEFALPYTKEICEKVLAMGYRHIYCHICGDHNLNLPYWAQVPMGNPGIISIGHEVELETAAKYFPNNIISGNLEPAIIQVGTADEVYEATRKVIEKGKKLPTGYIFSPGCDIPPMAPAENVEAITRAINDFGRHD